MSGPHNHQRREDIIHAAMILAALSLTRARLVTADETRLAALVRELLDTDNGRTHYVQR